MKSLYITENEKKQILDLHKNRMLSEQAMDGGTPITVDQIKSTPINVGTQSTNQTTTTTTQPATNQVTTTTTTTNQTTKAPSYTIQQLQQLLNSKGYNVGAADNKLGKNTLAQIEAAIKVVKSNTSTPPKSQTPIVAKDDIEQTKDTSAAPKDQEIKLG